MSTRSSSLLASYQLTVWFVAPARQTPAGSPLPGAIGAAVIRGQIGNGLELPAGSVPLPPAARVTRRTASAPFRSGTAPPGVQPVTAQLPALASGRAAGLVISVKPAGPAPSGSSSIFTAPSWPEATHRT